MTTINATTASQRPQFERIQDDKVGGNPVAVADLEPVVAIALLLYSGTIVYLPQSNQAALSKINFPVALPSLRGDVSPIRSGM
ncbi:MAG TPA: hypothetical protein VFI87_09875, partial [Hyphomicrobiaceae bacterium]|nr:hypothetical protein [Hyphomicrobiaceae bacterium]